MIKFGPYTCLSWQAVKHVWKRDGIRDTPTGVPDLPCYQYAVGENFLLYPNQSQRPPGDICEIPREGIRHNVRLGASIYGNRYCSTLNPF